MPREDKGTRLSLSLSLFHFRSATTIRIEKFQIFLNEMSLNPLFIPASIAKIVFDIYIIFEF